MLVKSSKKPGVDGRADVRTIEERLYTGAYFFEGLLNTLLVPPVHVFVFSQGILKH